ncbi:MAG: GNAT family N-acetyltransferase [Rhodothermales bacterium]
MADASPYRTSLHRLSDPAVRPAWDRLLAQSAQATAYADLRFAARVEAALGLPAFVASVWEDDVLRAGALVFEKRRGPYRAAALPPLVQYVSPLLDGDLRETDVHHHRSPLDALLGLIAGTFHQATLVLHPSLGDVRPFQWQGWRVEPAFTYRIDLQAQDAVTSGWSSNPKRTLKRERDDFVLADGAQYVAEALALVEASHARQGQSLGIASESAAALAHGLAEDGLVRAFVARRDGTAEAGLLVLSDGRTAHYWLAGSEPGAAMTVLLGHVLPRLREEGVATFDFVGANTPSIAEFKRRFGSALVPYFRARHTARPELRLLDRLRR